MSMLSASAGFISKYRTIIQVTLGAVLLAVTLVRLGTVFHREIFTDYLAYADTTQSIMAGSNPYALENMRYRAWGEAPIVYPGYVFFFQSIAGNAQKFLPWYLLLSIIASFAALAWLLKKTGFKGEPSPLRNSRGFFICSVLIFAFFNASPVLKTLRLGQSTAIIAFCLVAMLLGRRQIARYFFFGTAAVMKYSLLTVWAPLLFFKKYYRLCLFGLLFFILAGLYPVFFYPNIVGLIKAYLQELASQISGTGFNTYSVSGFDMLHLDFIKSSLVATSLKVTFVAAWIGLFLKERKQRRISINLLFSASCLTMLISYHRLHDVITILPFLGLLCYVFFRENKYGLLTISSFFYLYFLIPESIIFRISSFIGTKLLFLQQWIYLCSYSENAEQWNNLVPINAVVMLLLTGFSYYLNACQDSPYYFKLDSSEPD